MKASTRPLVFLAILAACVPDPSSDTAVVLTESDSDADSSGSANPTLPVTTTSTVTTVASTTSGSTTNDSDTSSDTSSDTDSTTDAPCNGDLTCDADEATVTCLHDCALCILDGACDNDLETAHSCPAECPPTACQLDGVLDPLSEQCDDGNLDDDDACTNACALNICGDGHHFPSEEACDDGNVVDGDGCSSTCTRETLFVFVTSQTFQGNLHPVLNNKAGLALADAHCQALATQATLPGTYRAWLSDGAIGPATRFNIPLSYPGAFTRTDGAVIAEGWADLLDGTLAAPIDRDEAGAVLTDTLAWTNTAPNGAPAGAQNCMNWSSNNIMHKGQIGANAATDAAWTNFDANFCANASRLYCFQLP